jgi:hypothetical protein
MSRWFTITPGKIAAMALLLVGVSTAFVIFMQIRLTNILAAPDWCARAINAERLAQTRTASAIESCISLLDKQVGSLAINSHIFAGIIALCLLVLVVIVLAGGRLNLKASKDGVDVDISRDAEAAATEVADAAVERRDEIVGGA